MPYDVDNITISRPRSLGVPNLSLLKKDGTIVGNFDHQAKGDYERYVRFLREVARKCTPNLAIEPVRGRLQSDSILATIHQRTSKPSALKITTIGSVNQAEKETIRNLIELQRKYPQNVTQLLAGLRPVIETLRNFLVTDCCLVGKMPHEPMPIKISVKSAPSTWLLREHIASPIWTPAQELCLQEFYGGLTNFIKGDSTGSQPAASSVSKLGAMLPADLRSSIDSWIKRVAAISENIKGKNPIYPPLYIEAPLEIHDSASAYIQAAVPNSQIHRRMLGMMLSEKSSLSPQAHLVNSHGGASDTQPEGDLVYRASSNGLTCADISRILPLLAQEKFQHDFHAEVSRQIKWSVVGTLLEGLSTSDLKTLVDQLHLRRANLRQEMALRHEEFPNDDDGSLFKPPKLEAKDFIVLANSMHQLRDKLAQKISV